jgi:hypothetical protein
MKKLSTLDPYAVLMVRLMLHYQRTPPSMRKPIHHHSWLAFTEEMYDLLHIPYAATHVPSDKLDGLDAEPVLRFPLHVHKYCTTCNLLHSAPAGTTKLFTTYCSSCITTRLPTNHAISNDTFPAQIARRNPVLRYIDRAPMMLAMEDVLVYMNDINMLTGTHPMPIIGTEFGEKQ